MSDTVYVPSLPDCDMHKVTGITVAAAFDARTTSGRWANLCQECFDVHGVGLGTGKGQRFIVGSEPRRNRSEVRREILRALEAGDIEAAFDACGDEDPALFL